MKTKFMHGDLPRLLALHGTNLQAVSLPYANPRLSMVVVPDAGQFSQVAHATATAGRDAWWYNELCAWVVHGWLLPSCWHCEGSLLQATLALALAIP